MPVPRRNCSSYNPCGKYGYCEDDLDGEWSCSCILWWSGPVCNKLTDSGVQVIILGCLLGILMMSYYGLMIRRYRSRKKSGKNTTTLSRKITLPFPRPSVAFAPLIVVIAASALLIKWSMIQPIHNEIVDRYRHNLSLFFEPHAICRVMNYEKLNLIMFPLSCLLVFLFAIDYKRKTIAPPVPVDFFTETNRVYVAVVFAIAANELLEIVNDAFNNSPSADKGIVLVYLRKIFQVLVMGFRYYPLLTAVHLDSLWHMMLGAFYSWLELPMTMIEQGMCQPKYYSTVQKANESFTDLLLNYYGTGRFLVVVELITDVPRYLCMCYIIVRLSRRLYEQVRHRSVVDMRTSHLTSEAKALLRVVDAKSVEMRYVRNLLRTHQRRTSRRWMREWQDDFRYSSRVLSVYSSIFLFLYYILIQGGVQLLPYMALAQEGLQALIDKLRSTPSAHPIPLFVRPFLLALIIGSVVVVIQLLTLLSSIRRNLFQVYRGDDSEIPRRNRSAYVSYATGNFHFAGYLIAYALWSLILTAFSIFVVLIFIEVLITFRPVRLLLLVLQYLMPILLMIYFKGYLNACLARFAFLQDGGHVLAVNNRRILMIFLYFNFFLDAFLGLLSSITRLLRSVLAGIIYMCRLDYSPLGRKLETMDAGFNAYCGFIHMECAHRHPILLVFASHLLDAIVQRPVPTSLTNALAAAVDHARPRERSPRIIRKWQMAAFLLRNPSLVFFRKAYFNQFHLFETRPVRHRHDLNADRTNIPLARSVSART